MTAQKTLQRLLDMHGENAHSLSIKTGVSQPSIRRILLGLSREPRRSTLQPIADFFGVDISAFMLDADLSTPVRSIPLFNVPGEYMVLPDSLVARMKTKPEAAFVMQGDALPAGIRHGEIMLIDMAIRDFVGDGFYLLTSINGAFVQYVQRVHTGTKDAGVIVIGKAIGIISVRDL